LTRPSALPGRALVVGLARSGEAAALALARRDVAVVGADRDPGLDAGRLRAAGVEVRLGADADVPLLEGVEVLVKSPGVGSDTPLVEEARRRRVPVWSEIELGARLVAQPTVGVTGTNGKTTTTELVGAMLRAAGGPVAVCGNVGRPLCALDGELAGDETVVCELSSFQLEDVDTLHCRVAVLLNLTPDHLDRHGDLSAYRQAKLRIFENQGRGDVAIVPRGLDLGAGGIPGGARRVEFGARDPLPAEPLIPGEHNRENAAAATAAARAAGVPDEAIAEALRTFPGVAHRLEPIRELGGVRFVNDSKATNPESAERALRAYEPGTLRVILGGSRKGSSFAALAGVAKERGVLCAYLVGETAEELGETFAAAGVPFVRTGDLERAVAEAWADARPGEIVLLSPACASFDQFRDFEHRGESFRNLVEALR
jgi:UDP-N-acetylmuramoylalanine--D-glutamate ligase